MKRRTLDHPFMEKGLEKALKIYDKHGDYIYFHPSNMITRLFWRNGWATFAVFLVGILVYFSGYKIAGITLVAIAGFIYLTLIYHRKGFVDGFERGWQDGWDTHVDHHEHKGKFHKEEEL